MTEVEERPEKTINRSLLVAASKVIAFFNTNEFDSSKMGEMREQAFKLLSKEDFSKVIDYTG